MSEKIVQLNEEIIKGQLKELVRGSVEEILNELLEKERYYANTLANCLQRLSGEISENRQYVITDGSVNGLSTFTEQIDLTGSGTYQLRSPDSSMAKAGTDNYDQGKRFIYTFRGWRVKATGDILNPDTPLTMQQLYALESGGSIELEAVWSALDTRGKVASANFYINLNCEIKDAHSNGFNDNPISDYTKSVFTNGMVGTEQLSTVEDNFLLLAPSTTESSAYDVDSTLRTMTDTPYSGITMTSFPADQDVFAAIKAGGYTIKVNGYEVPAQYLTSDYAFELDDGGTPIRDGNTSIVSDTPFTVTGGGEAIEISSDHPSDSVTITNQITYAELPETGSLGSGMIYALGGL